ncbi:MAG: ester cyclase [Maribacter sp.]|nr:ester cyclase [Maribacter sp.]MBT8302110.1 ester cyclase [Maribacter sp.]NND78891.1 SnoaL-like domain-containing protein [Maribacter sp.]
MKRKGLLSVILLFMIFTCSEGTNKTIESKREKAITSNFNSFIENAWNNKNMDSLRSVSGKDYIRQLNGINVAENLNELEANMNIYFNGFPDLKVTILNKTIKNNQLFAQWSFEATNTGIFGETPATGKHVVVSGYSELTFDNQFKIMHEKIYYNELQFLQQLGYTLNEPIVE